MTNLEVLDALPGGGLCVHNNGLHVAAQLFGDGHVVLLVDRLRHVDHPVVHACKQLSTLYPARQYFRSESFQIRMDPFQ